MATPGTWADDGSKWTHLVTGEVAPPGSLGAPRFAGHVPGRVLVGFSAVADGNTAWAYPGWTEQQQIIDRQIYLHRAFTPSTNANAWLSWIQGAHAQEYSRPQGACYPILSFKCSSYTTMRDGGYASQMDAIRQWAKTRRTSGPGGTPQPFTLTFDHEPIGNPGGTLKEWGEAHTVLSNFFAGWTTNSGTWTKNTYNAADDVTDIMAWHSCPNGHPWRPNWWIQSYVDDMCPPFLIETFNENGSIIAPDFYDPNPNNARAWDDPTRFDESYYQFRPNQDRTSVGIQGFITWGKAQGIELMACNEFSAITGAEFTNAWHVIRANRDRWVWASAYSSPQNSRWDWRLIPEGYPGGQFPDVQKSGQWVLRDFGGKSSHQNRLNAFRTMVDESISPQFTGA